MAALALAGLGAFASLAGAQTVTVSAAADTYLRQGLPNQNQGEETALHVQQLGRNRTLVRMDQAAIAAAVGSGSLVSATLELYATSSGNWGSAGRTVDLHRLSTDWTETGATWSCPNDTLPNNILPNCPAQWDGGTFEAEASDSLLHTNTTSGYVQLNVTEDVRSFLAGTPNHGWLAKLADETAGGNVDYVSREGLSTRRPRLVLVVESPAFDQVPPSLEITSPAQAVLVNETAPQIALSYGDGGSGVNLSSFSVRVDGVAASCTAGASAATCVPAPLAEGSHTITASLRDQAGNEATASRSFTLLVGPGRRTTTFPAVGDTYLRQGEPNQNFGGESILRVRQSGRNRSLVRFDAAEIARVVGTGTLVAARLELAITKNGRNWGLLGNGRMVDAHRLTADWTETGATWSCAVDTNLGNSQPSCSPQWSGGTFQAAATASVLHTNSLSGTVSFDVTADVASLLSGTPNHGWLLKKREEGQSGSVEYASREAGAATAPRLVLVFDVPPGSTDTTAPAIAITAPVGPLVINDPAPAVVIQYSDSGSGIDPASLRVRSGALDFTVTCVTGAGSATCRPPFLGAGGRTIVAEVADLAGNSASASQAIEILIDREPPRLEIASPGDLVLLASGTPVIEVRYGDVDSGVDPATLRVLLDGTPLTGCTVGPASATCTSGTLAEGAHTVSAEIADRVGLSASASRAFTFDLDAVAPTISFAAPTAPAVLLAQPPLEVELVYADADTGLDLASFVLLADGEDRGDACELLAGRADCALELGEGSHSLQASVRDRAGNLATAAFTVQLALDSTPPTVAILAPTQPDLREPPAIAIDYADAGSGLDLSKVLVTLDATDVTASCSVGPAGASCPALASLGEGAHTLVAEVQDQAGNRAQASRSFALALRDRTPPTLTLLSPQGGVLLSGGVPRIEVSYEDASGVDLASFFAAIDEEAVTASCQVSATGAVCQPAALAAGQHSLRIELRDTEDNLATLVQTFDLELQLPVRITEPALGTLVAGLTVDVRGTVSAAANAVKVGGVDAVVDNGTFVAEDVPLHEGANVLSAVASSALGGVGTDTVTVVRDTLKPQIVIFSPRDGSVTQAQQILVTGEVNDPASSSSAQAPPVVRVGGVEVPVEQRSFVVPDFLLQPGENVLQVEAVDAAGNVGTTQVRVTYVIGAAQRIEEMIGNGQTGPVGAQLAEPLGVRLVDFAGQPLAGRTVRFEVTRGNGQVGSFPDAGANVEVLTDANGMAQVFFALGERSGRGNHEVTATSPGIPGEVVFCASAEPTLPRRIKRIVGNNMTGAQTAIADAEAPYPLLTQVFDDFGNPVAGVEVTYTVIAGGGHFAGQTSYAAETDSWGKASATFTLGPQPGINNNLVEATVAGISETGALFNFSTVAPREGDTTLSGLVLDNQDAPVPGVTLHIGDRTAVSDAEGRFRLTGLPEGTVHLGIDGATATRPGRWPHLGFEFTLVRGIENSLGMAIRLLPIDESSARIVGGAEDVKVPMSGVPGAELTVFANSVTFPDGSKVGELTFTQVHSDKVPMVAPMGSDFMLAFTIQPPGTVFDPPVRIAIPNLGGKPGSVVDMFSFDHDLGEFITAGTAMISADGLQLVSTPGSGISKAGWGGCVAPPPPDSDVCNPSMCTICPPGARRPEPKCGKCETCNGGTCEPKGIKSVKVKANGKSEDTVVVGKEQEVQLTAEVDGDCNKKYAWDFGDGETSEEPAPLHEYKEKGLYTVRLEVSCRDCQENGSETDELKVRAIEIDLEIKELPEETEPSPNEEEPGALLVVNSDDDNENDKPDSEDTGEVNEEDDLVELKVKLDNEVDTGELRLEAAAGGEAVKVWEAETKRTRIELPKTWKLAEGEEVPESVWVEGADGSDVKEVELRLLYTNDAGAEVEDKVVLTALEVDFVLSPGEESLVEANLGQTDLGVSVFLPDFEDEQAIRPASDAQVEWELTEGSGSLGDSLSRTEEGFAGTILRTVPTPGTTSRVAATLKSIRLDQQPFEGEEIEMGLRLETGPIKIIPGLPATITIQPSRTSFAADDVDTITLQAQIRDAVGNPVADGTEVSWVTGQGSRLLGVQTRTAGGLATATIQATDVPGSEEIEVRSGAVVQTLSIDIQSVNAVLTISPATLDVNAGQTAQVTLASNAADGAEVFWMTSNGTLTGGTRMFGGLATATLSTENGRPGPAIITATVGFAIKFFRAEFTTSAPVAIWSDPPLLIGDAVGGPGESALATVKAESAMPTTTTIHVKGAPGAVALFNASGAQLTEAFTFDTQAGGTVPGVVAAHDLTLAGAAVSTAQAHMGGASLRLDAGATATLADAAEFDFEDKLNVTFWLRPDATAGSGNLISKNGAWTIELLGDGKLRARLETAGGGTTLTTERPLDPGKWNLISLLVTPGKARLNVNSETQAGSLAAPLATTATPIVIGGGFNGYFDDLALYSESGGFELFWVDGVDAAGQVVLGPDGRAALRANSRGAGDFSDGHVERVLISVGVLPVAEPLNGLNGTLKAMSPELAKIDREFVTDVLVFWGQGAWEDTQSAFLAFIGADPDGAADFIASLLGGVLGIADVGALIKNAWRAAGGSDTEVNKVEVFFALVGIATTIAPHVDVAVGAGRSIVARIGNSPLTEALFKRFYKLIIEGDDFIAGEVDLYRKLAGNLDQAGRLGPLLDDELLAAVTRLDEAFGGVCSLAAAKSQGDCFLAAINAALAASDGPTLKALLKAIDEAEEGWGLLARAGTEFPALLANMAKVVKAGIEPGVAMEILQNCRNICTEGVEGAYTAAKLFDDLQNVSDVPGFESLAKRLRAANKMAAGFRYELEVANFCKRTAGRVLQFVDLAFEVVIDGQLQASDIDVACEVNGKKVLYQVKRSADAFKTIKDGTKLTRVKAWVAKARQFAKEVGFDEVRYAVPSIDDVPSTVYQGDKLSVLEYLQRYTGGIDEIPHAPVPF